MSPTLDRPVDDWLDGSLNFTAIIAVSALIAVIIAGVLVGLAIMTVRRTSRRPGPAPRRREHHPGAPGVSPESPGDG